MRYALNFPAPGVSLLGGLLKGKRHVVVVTSPKLHS
jgi:hypothetical protein